MLSVAVVREKVTLIQIPAWGTMSLLELLWTLIGLATIAICLFNLLDVTRDLALSSLARKRIVYLLAWGYVRREVLRVGAGVLITFIGLAGIVQGSPVEQNKVTIFQLVLTVCLFLLGAEAVVQSILDRRLRRHAEELGRDDDASLR